MQFWRPFPYRTKTPVPDTTLKFRTLYQLKGSLSVYSQDHSIITTLLLISGEPSAEVLEGASSRISKFFCQLKEWKNERQTRLLYPLRMRAGYLPRHADYAYTTCTCRRAIQSWPSDYAGTLPHHVWFCLVFTDIAKMLSSTPPGTCVCYTCTCVYL